MKDSKTLILQINYNMLMYNSITTYEVCIIVFHINGLEVYLQSPLAFLPHFQSPHFFLSSHAGPCCS